MRRSDDKRSSIQLLRKQSRHVRLTESDYVRQKYTAIFIENLARAQRRLLLILQSFEVIRQANVTKLRWRIQFIAEVLVKEFQIEFIWCEMSEWRPRNYRVLVWLPKINSGFPKF